jgi:carboxymethylenebutenolidase
MHTGMIDMEPNTTLVQCYPAHEAYPDGAGPFPPVLVLHDRFGLTPFVRGAATRLAREGFYTLTPNLYAICASFVDVAPDFMHTAGPSYVPYDEEEAADSFAQGLTDERADVVVSQALAYIAGRSHARNGSVGVLGFSMGSRLAVLAARRHADEIAAVVAFSPAGLVAGGPRKPGPLLEGGELKASLLLLCGASDDELRADERDAAEKLLSFHHVPYRMEVFPHTPHEFYCPERDCYRVGAARQSWDLVVQFLRENLDAGEHPN